MRRGTRWPLAAGLILGVVWFAVAPAAPPAAAQAEARVAPDAEAEFVARINDLRRSKGLQELATDGPLVSLARRWAASMAAAGRISHDPNLRNEVPEPWERVGENVGVGPSVASLHDAFVASASHYRNLVEPRYSRLGVGVVRTADGTLYTTQLFLQPPAAAAPARASRSRPPVPMGAATRAVLTSPAASTPPRTAGEAMAWSGHLLRSIGPSAEPTAPLSLADAGSDGTVPSPLVTGGVLTAALLAVAVRMDRRRVRRRRRAKERPSLGAALARYTTTTPPTLPLTSGLRWESVPPDAVGGEDGGDGALTAALAPYTVSRVATGWRLEDLADGLDGVVLVVGEAGRVRYASPTTERILGYGPGSLAGLAFGDLVHPDDTGTPAVVGAQGAPEMRLRHRDGSWRHIEITTEDRRQDPGIAGMVARGSDVTELRAVEAEMRNRAERDPVTGLIGRTTLAERLARAIERLDLGTDCLAVLAVHLGGLEVVHEVHGPVIVDCLVGAAAERLQTEVGPAALVGRYGDHDFAVVASATAAAAATETARAALAALGAPFVALAEPVTLMPSVGIAIIGQSDVPATQALQQAYVAMRAAQRRGGDRIEVFRPSLGGPALSRLRDERALRLAHERRELCLHYQPIVRAATGDMIGVEALMRWVHPERGVVSAGEFIGVAEEAGLIAELGWWALRVACAEAERWAHMAPTFRVSVNVSARQLADPGFADHVFGTLADTDAPPSSLSLELTETTLLDDIADGAERLQAVRDRGVTIAVDDFGTGYSSLGYLQQLPIDTIKVDRSFVTDLGHTAAADTIASAVVGLAHGLGLTTVAEGVETEAQAGALAALGCDNLQGYLCSPARPAPEIDGLFDTPLVGGVIDVTDTTATSRLTVP